MRKPYCCEASQHLFDQYYSRQQKGGAIYPVYVGRARQRGHGIGDIFKSIWRFFFPALKTIAPHALRAGANIVEDATRGSSWKDSTLRHGSSVLDQVPAAIRAGVSASKNQSGSGRRRKRIAKRRRSAKRAKKRDIFS